MSDLDIPKSKDEAFNNVIEGKTGVRNSELNKLFVFDFIAKDVSESISNLKNAMDKNASSNNKLSKQLIWLNIVLPFATVLILIYTILIFIKR